MNLGLKGRKAFITGASRGIGAAIARALAAEGVSLALFGRDTASCKSLAAELTKRHPKIRVLVCKLDLEKGPTIRPAIARAAAALGGCDILVNCAGGAYRAQRASGKRGRLEDIPDRAWDTYFQVKPLGLIRVTRECLLYLRKSTQARVINIAGTRGREPSTFSTMGAPINMATLGVTKVMANQLGPQGITVNCINPGTTATRRWTELVHLTAQDRGISIEEAEKDLANEVPLGRVVMPEDIANLAVFLASAGAGMISGVAINVDGGRSRAI